LTGKTEVTVVIAHFTSDPETGTDPDYKREGDVTTPITRSLSVAESTWAKDRSAEHSQ
jgi:hypothetical protein